MKVGKEQLRWSCNIDEIKQALTECISCGDIMFGQPRAEKAIEVGLNIDRKEFNIFIAGPEGTGRRTFALKKLKEAASNKPVPDDWCYVFNFKDPQSPKALRLPAGKGKELQEDMKNFIENVKKELPKAFESPEYEQKAKEIYEQANSQKEKLLSELNKMAENAGFALKFSPSGIVMIPIIAGQIIPEERLLSDPGLREYVDRKRKEFEPVLSEYMKKIKDIEKKMQNDIKKLREDVALFVVKHFIDDLKEKYHTIKPVTDYLDEVKKDIVDNIDLFLQIPSSAENPFTSLQIEKSLSKYRVNVIVDNSHRNHAPVIYETNPTYSNLFGRIALRLEFGIYVADFTQIVPGSIHKANGGYLLLRLKDVLMNPGVWHTLKRVLLHKEITIQPFLEDLGIPHPLSTFMRPEPIPLDIKVVLIGDRLSFYLLRTLDPEFERLFKIKAEFDEEVENNPENIKLYAVLIGQLAAKENLLPLEEEAIARIIEYSVRLSGNQKKLYLKFGKLLDVLHEANYYAQKEKSEKIRKEHVDKTLKEIAFRSNLIEQKIQELIKDGTIIIDLEDRKIGQINGLSIYNAGDYQFGRPVRITARVFMGKKGIINIEREADLSGKIFNKASFILTGYIAGKYAEEDPLSISATVAFEQSYSTVEGDSASAAELLAILSSIAKIPIKQNIAITGSIDQMGNIQPVGGINEKIEGFYKICKILNKNGAVIIPKRNLQNLQLESEIIEAVEKDLFKIYAIETIDEAIEILTDKKAVEFHQEVRKRLKNINEKYERKDNNSN